MFPPVRPRGSVLLLMALLALSATWVESAEPPSLSVRLALAKKADKPSMPSGLSDVAADLQRLGYNSATLLSSASLDTSKENSRRIPIESGFSVTVSVKPPEAGKVPVVVVWEKGGKQNKVNARVRGPFISGGGSYKDGTLLLILKAP